MRHLIPHNAGCHVIRLERLVAEGVSVYPAARPAFNSSEESLKKFRDRQDPSPSQGFGCRAGSRRRTACPPRSQTGTRRNKATGKRLALVPRGSLLLATSSLRWGEEGRSPFRQIQLGRRSSDFTPPGGSNKSSATLSARSCSDNHLNSGLYVGVGGSGLVRV